MKILRIISFLLLFCLCTGYPVILPAWGETNGSFPEPAASPVYDNPPDPASAFRYPDNYGEPLMPDSGIFAPYQPIGRNFSTQDRGSPDSRMVVIPEDMAALLSILIPLVLLVMVLYAGLRIGRSFRYDLSLPTRRWIMAGHIISSVLLMGSMWLLFHLTSLEPMINPLPQQAYSFIGIQLFLILSSLFQAWSLHANRPLQPLHHVHILFTFIGIIILMTVRSPVFGPFSLTVLAITILYIPGAVLSLFCGYVTRMDHPGTDSPGTITQNRPMSDGIEIPSSFPGKLLGKYRDIRVIGSGGMAIVYRAVRIEDDREVAVKIPFSPDEESGRTFLNEILLWRDLDHANIAQILDHNIFPVPYVEIEYIPRTLRDMTRPVSPGRAVSIIRDVASALAYAHEKGVIHRDIKPGNVLVTNEGTCKLTDWGLSRSLSKRDETRNMSFSLQYATPEQLAPARYGTGDERIDLYQLGILLYELLCGRPPYDTDSIGTVFQNIQENRFPLPSEFSSRLAGYDPVIIRALKADPSERYNNIREFLEAIESVDNTE